MTLVYIVEKRLEEKAPEFFVFRDKKKRDIKAEEIAKEIVNRNGGRVGTETPKNMNQTYLQFYQDWAGYGQFFEHVTLYEGNLVDD